MVIVQYLLVQTFNDPCCNNKNALSVTKDLEGPWSQTVAETEEVVQVPDADKFFLAQECKALSSVRTPRKSNRWFDYIRPLRDSIEGFKKRT